MDDAQLADRQLHAERIADAIPDLDVLNLIKKLKAYDEIGTVGVEALELSDGLAALCLAVAVAVIATLRVAATRGWIEQLLPSKGLF